MVQMMCRSGILSWPTPACFSRVRGFVLHCCVPEDFRGTGCCAGAVLCLVGNIFVSGKLRGLTNEPRWRDASLHRQQDPRISQLAELAGLLVFRTGQQSPRNQIKSSEGFGLIMGNSVR
ncbi:hypothetical protein MHYP_G00356620 [Metynnis hypsauchen]